MPALFFAVLVSLCVCAGFCQTAEADVPVGVAAVDITPDHPIMLNGFGFRREEATVVRQRIWAKALAIGSDEQRPVVLIAVDTLGIPAAFVDKLAARLKEKTGIERDRLAVLATHTHTAPMVNGVSPTLFGIPISPERQAHIDQYTDFFQQKLEEVALDALADRQPATLSWGLGSVGFATNRRAAGGPADHDLPLLVVTADDGSLRAMLVNYACHCVNLSDNQISGDWAGYAQQHIERQYPGCTAMVAIGCGADANPSTGVVGDRADVAERHGLEIAQEVNRLIKAGLSPVEGPIEAKLERIRLPLAPPPTRGQWDERARKQDAVGHHARTQLARLERGEKLLTEIDYSVQSWSFGDSLGMVFLPGEVVVDYSLRLKKQLDGRRLWVNAYANGCPGYIPSERILREGGYEGGDAMIYYDLPGPYAPGLEDKIVAAAERQLGARFAPAVDAGKTQGSLPRPRQQAVAALRPRAGLVVDLVASEPLVASPVAIDFGPDGRLWIAEMYDYPAGVDNNFAPGGRIKFLEDTDRDGHYDRATTFLEGIPFPTGVTVWRGGVLVCAAPDILYAEDADGDGRAEIVKKLYSGFATHNYQARVNSLEYGLDGWVYGSCGLFGGDIHSFAGGEPLALGARDFRIRPDTGEIEPVAGNTQQGRVRDDWGNWFGCTNSVLLQQYVLTEHYLRRNPNVAPPSPVASILNGREPGRVFPIAETVRFKLSGTPGQVTAACGLGIYRDELLGGDYRGNAFTCEPVNNLVHRRILERDGLVSSARRAEDEANAEFLTSNDVWFRPVQSRAGPDGALWVVDMYRYVIEHPVWIPPETRDTLDVRAGSNMGRIYRVHPQDQAPRPMPRLDELDGPALAAALDSPNGWQRDMVQQLLQWQKKPATRDPLDRLAQSAERAEVRLQALCTLGVLDWLAPQTLVQALSDPHPAIRRHAVRLAEARMVESPEVARAVLDRTSDKDVQVVMQVAYSLGEWSNPRSAAALASLLRQHADQPYIVAAALSSLNGHNIAAVLDAALAARPGSDAPDELSAKLRETLFTQAAALGDDSLVGRLAGRLLTAPPSEVGAASLSEMTTMLAMLKRRDRQLEKLLDKSQHALFAQFVEHARDAALDELAPDDLRMAAIRLLGQTSSADDAELVARLLVARNSLPVQSAAVATLAQLGAEVPARLLAGWRGHGPQVSGQILDVLLSRSDWTVALLDAVESKQVAAADIDLVRRQRLTQHAEQQIHKRATSLLATSGDGDRAAVVKQYADALKLTGNEARGKALFENRCAVCHRLADIGNAVGPDLGIYVGKPPQALLIAVFDPNQAVDPRYHNYAAALKDGRVLTGIIIDETATSLTLVSSEGKKLPVLRADLNEISNSGKSLMPEGFERDVTPQDFADLWAWLRQMRPPFKELPGNSPALVTADATGSLPLTADRAQIHGQDITYETTFGNIGYWHELEDYAQWQFELPRGGRMDVWIDWACANESAGNPFRIDVGASGIEGTIEATGGWNVYRQARVGTLDLPQGRGDLVVRPREALKGALADLRGVYLVPAGQTLQLVAHKPPATVNRDDPASLARFLINDSVPSGEREAMVVHTSGKAADVVAVMAAGVTPGTPEEYRRIPWIWRVAIAAGRHNNADELRKLLHASLPPPTEPLRDWQAVVVGGGIINGVSQAGAWPQERIAAVLQDDKPLRKRWERALELAATMADKEETATGTRYDALRMVAMQSWETSRPQLLKYLRPGVNDELQMGAVSGLADIPAPEVTAALLGGLDDYSPTNRNLALDGLLRTPERATVLLRSVASGDVTAEQLGPERIDRLRKHDTAAVRKQAIVLFGE